MPPTYQGRSQAIHVGGSGAALDETAAHGWRCSIMGTQVIADGATAVIELSTNIIADTDGYWDPINPDQVVIPGGLGGVYIFGGDLFTPSYLAGLHMEIKVDEDGDGEDPIDYIGDGDLIHTRTPRSTNPLTGFYRVKEGGIITIEVTNNTGGSRTLQKGSFTGVLLIPDHLVGDPRLDHCQWTDASPITDHESCHLSVAGKGILLLLFFQQRPNNSATYPVDWHVREEVDGEGGGSGTLRYGLADTFIADAGTSLDAFLTIETAAAVRAHGALMAFRKPVGETGTPKETHSAVGFFGGGTNPSMSIALDNLPEPNDVLIGYVTATNGGGSAGTADELFSWPAGWRKLEAINPGTSEIGQSEVRYKVANGSETVTTVQYNSTVVNSEILMIANYGPMVLR